MSYLLHGIEAEPSPDESSAGHVQVSAQNNVYHSKPVTLTDDVGSYADRLTVTN